MPQLQQVSEPELITAPPERSTRPRYRVGGVWSAVALYAGLRAFGVLVTWWFAADRHRSVLRLLGGHDAVWYAGIARHGYDAAIPLRPDGGLAMTNLAFFPLFPGLIALADPVLPGGTATAGVVISWLAGLAAAGLLYAIGAHLRDCATGILLAALWAVLPHAFIESMGYTETLFTALAAGSMLALLRRSWLTAGVFCLLAGLTRPTGSAIILVVGLTALIAVVRRRDGWRPWAAGLLAPLGLIGFMAWVGQRLGRVDGYLHVQNDAWRMYYDLGSYTAGTARGLLLKASPLALYVVSLTLLIAVALLIIMATDRTPWQLTVYSAAIVAMAFFGDSYYNSKARLLIPAFPLLLPIASALAKARRVTTVVVIGLLAVVSAGYGVYLSLVWTYSP